MTTTAKATHTPGPWVVRDTGDQVLAPDGFPVANIEYMAVLPHWDVHYPEAQHWSRMEGKTFVERSDAEVAANARVIAAAPDLLAALMALAATIPQMDQNGDAAHEWLAARAAIAKATGDDA